jgi:E3 ubiquitin-protein ligase MARCH6
MRLSKLFIKAVTRFWKYLAYQLRLTSFIFGGRHPSEEFASTTWAWHSLFSTKPAIELDDADRPRDGGFRRMPATDDIVLSEALRRTVNVDGDGNPVGYADARTMLAQDAAVLGANRIPKKEFTIVYVPPHFRRRVTAFIAIFWATACFFLSTLLVAPIYLGRGIFNALLGRSVHDGYAFLSGFYAFWACLLFGRALQRLDRRRQRQPEWRGPLAPQALWIAKRGALWVGKMAYMTFWLGFIVPALLSLVFEAYVVLPLRLTFDPDMEVHVRLVDMWMQGILYTTILLKMRGLQAPGPVVNGVQKVNCLVLRHYRCVLI